MPTFSIPNSISPGDPSDATKAMANWNQIVNDLNTTFPSGSTEPALSTWKPYCILGAQVGSAVSATRFFSPGNVAGTGAALAACLFPINITGLVAGSRTTQWRLVWAGQVNVVAPVVTFTIAMYGASSSAGGSGSGSTVSKGTLVAGSGTTWVTPTGGLTSANNIGPTFTVAASGSYVIAVDPSVATAANSVTDFVVALQYQQV